MLAVQWVDAYQMVAIGSPGPSAYPGFIEIGIGLFLG